MNEPHEYDAGLPQVYQPRPDRSWLVRAAGKVAGIYDPKPMVKPEIDENLDKMGALELVAETFAYNVDSFLYAISPRGELQAWWKMMIRLTLFCLPVGIFFVLATFMLAWGGGYLEAAALAIEHSLASIGLATLCAVAVALFISSIVIFFKSKFFSLFAFASGLVFCVFLVIAIVKAMPEVVQANLLQAMKGIFPWW
jgi:cation transport ATPase